MRRNNTQGRTSFRAVSWKLMVLMLCLSAGTVLAVGRAGGGLVMVIDAFTAGGGPGTAANYHEADSALGQEANGYSENGNVREWAGVVLSWNGAPAPFASPTPTPGAQSLGIADRQWDALP